jgi:hypothetical protein
MEEDMKKLVPLVTITLVLLVSIVGATEEKFQQDNVLIYFSSYVDNLHAVSMALKIG